MRQFESKLYNFLSNSNQIQSFLLRCRSFYKKWFFFNLVSVTVLHILRFKSYNSFVFICRDLPHAVMYYIIFVSKRWNTRGTNFIFRWYDNYQYPDLTQHSGKSNHVLLKRYFSYWNKIQNLCMYFHQFLSDQSLYSLVS